MVKIRDHSGHQIRVHSVRILGLSVRDRVHSTRLILALNPFGHLGLSVVALSLVLALPVKKIIDLKNDSKTMGLDRAKQH